MNVVRIFSIFSLPIKACTFVPESHFCWDFSARNVITTCRPGASRSTWEKRRQRSSKVSWFRSHQASVGRFQRSHQSNTRARSRSRFGVVCRLEAVEAFHVGGQRLGLLGATARASHEPNARDRMVYRGDLAVSSIARSHSKYV